MKLPVEILISDPWEFGEALGWTSIRGELHLGGSRLHGIVYFCHPICYRQKAYSAAVVCGRHGDLASQDFNSDGGAPCTAIGVPAESAANPLEFANGWRGGSLAFICSLKKVRDALLSIPAPYVRQLVSFLFQAELSIDRCTDVAQLREYYTRLWPGNSAEVLFAMRPNKETSARRAFNVFPGERIGALLQWYLFKRISLTVVQIAEAESCFCAFLSLLSGRAACTKDYLISMRMRLNAAANSLCKGLPKSCIQSFRKVEHLNSSPHLSLRAFSAESCGLLPNAACPS